MCPGAVWGELIWVGRYLAVLHGTLSVEAHGGSELVAPEDVEWFVRVTPLASHSTATAFSCPANLCIYELHQCCFISLLINLSCWAAQHPGVL